MAANHIAGHDEGKDWTLAGSVSSLWEQGLIQDCIIQIDGREFKVNKAIFASISSHFHSALMMNGANNNKPNMVMDGVSVDAMEILIPFIHTSKINITKKTVTNVLAAAVHLQVESAVRICTDFMVDDLNIHNWYKVLKVFRSHKLKEATEKVLNYAKKDMREIVKIFKDHKLPYDDLHFFIENWQSSEHDLFQFILEWVNADLANHKQYQDELLCNVRYCLMLPAELATIKGMKIFRKSPNPWRRFVTKAIKYHTLPVQQRVLDTSDQNKVRSPPSFVTFSKAQCENGGSFYEALKERCFIEREALKLSAEIGKYPKALVVNNFLVAGTDRKWAIFDPRTLQWSQIAKLDRRFKCQALTHDDKYLYAVGGVLEYDLFDTFVERYDFKTNTWKTFKKLPVDMSDCDACIIDKSLYICGGRPLALLCLDLVSKKWMPKAHLLKQHEWCTAHVMKVFGEESICLFDEACNMEYYVPSKDEWLRTSFSFSKVQYFIPSQDQWSRRTFSANIKSLCRRATTWGKNEHEMSCGNNPNMLFLSDVKTESAVREDQKTCAVVRFPEEGTEAVVDFLHEYARFRLADFCTILSIAPHTIRLGV